MVVTRVVKVDKEAKVGRVAKVGKAVKVDRAAKVATPVVAVAGRAAIPAVVAEKGVFLSKVGHFSQRFA